MADIELVIKISEKAYNALTHTEFDANLVVDEMRKSIVDGTPLPKGHSSLIDRQETLDTIIKRLGISGEKYLLESERAIYQQIMAMPTIIEADKVESAEEGQASKEELQWFDIA